jgi:DNA replication protein DnaC/transposase
MSNVLSDDKKQQVLALGRLGWTLRRIEEATRVRRETASSYLKAAGIGVRAPGRWGRVANPAIDPSPDSAGTGAANPAIEVTPDSDRGSAERRGIASACEPWRETIEAALRRGRNAKAIWQDLVDDHGFQHAYASVKRFVCRIRGRIVPDAHPAIATAPGDEGQVDYGDGPLVRDAETGKYRRTRLFVLTLGFSRKSVRLLVQRSSTKTWAELHEKAFQRLGGSPGTVVLDNLREGVLKPDIYDPVLNPLYRDVLAHYGAVALPCRVRDPNRKGKVESGVGHAQKKLRGLRFESLEEAQAYLDRWEERWADTRIHGTTKRQVAAMFEEERPALRPLPLEPFRYYCFGERKVHLDGCVEVEGAYYSAPPGMIGAQIPVRWDERRVRLLDPRTGQLLVEHDRQRRGLHRVREDHRSKRAPLTLLEIMTRAELDGRHIGELCKVIHQREGNLGARRILGVVSLAKKFGTTALDEACAVALAGGAATYRFVRQYLEHRRPLPLTLRQVDPLIRELTHYRDLIEQLAQKETTTLNVIELDRALRQLRLSGMAATLETRLVQAQAEKTPPLDFLSSLVNDELLRRKDRLLERRVKQAGFREPGKTLDSFDFDFNKKMNRTLVFELATGRFIMEREDALFLGPPGTGKSHLAQAIGHAVIRQGFHVLYREAHVLLEHLAEAGADGRRKEVMDTFSSAALLIIDDLGMRRLPHTAAEDLLELVMHRYERTSTLLTSNRPVEDWGKLLGDTAAVSAILDRLLHHAHVLKCGPKSWRTRLRSDLPAEPATK